MKCIDCGWYNFAENSCEELNYTDVNNQRERDCSYFIAHEERLSIEESRRIENKGW